MTSSLIAETLDRYFKISERGSTIGTEIRAGTASFFTLSYLLVVNPQILAHAGVSHADAVLATSLSSAMSCFLVGLGGNLPFGTAPGIGLSAYLSFSLVQTGLCTVEEALSAVFTSGIVVLLVTLTGCTSCVMNVVPDCVKYGIVVGMGLLIAMIGMVSVNLVVANDETLVGLGDTIMTDLALQLAIAGVILVGSLLYWNVKGGIVIGIVVIAIVQWTMTSTWPTDFIEFPTFDTNTNNNYITLGVMFDSTKAGVLWTAVGCFVLICVFDISGVIFGLATLGGLIEEGTGRIPGTVWVFVASSMGTIIAAYFGSTPIICCVETASGVKEGGRTGLTAIVIGLYFVLAVFLSPLFAAVPNAATAPVLIMVGVMMMAESSKVDWQDMSQAVPAFLTLALMPLTYSITNGMIFGLATAAAFYITTGQLWTDLLKACGGGGGGSGGYDTIIDGIIDDEEDPTTAEHHLLLGSVRSNSESAKASIRKARESLHVGERDVNYNSVLF